NMGNVERPRVKWKRWAAGLVVVLLGVVVAVVLRQGGPDLSDAPFAEVCGGCDRFDVDAGTPEQLAHLGKSIRPILNANDDLLEHVRRLLLRPSLRSG
ncbi:MAG TPA: hypothetical protein VFS18_00690, partial [Actinomycetota bacterium]|nr:hypothetical protein [Actinomycetota bacterium]